jgi:hypothetical protein
LCPLFVSITFTSILTYNNRMSWTFLCSWTEFNHGKETFLPLAKMTIYRKNPRTNAKRKAVDDLSARPSKVIRSELQTMNEKILEPNYGHSGKISRFSFHIQSVSETFT